MTVRTQDVADLYRSATLTYGYAADGSRIRATSPGSTDVLFPHREYESDLAAQVDRMHVFLQGVRLLTLERDSAGAERKIHYFPDQVGSNRLMVITDDGAPATTEFQYPVLDPFGEVMAVVDETGAPVDWSDLASPFLYAGHRYDTETNLYYMGARYYDPLTGRFLSRDPELEGPSPG